MDYFNLSQLFSFLTDVEKFSQNLSKTESSHLVVLRFPQFEEVFDLSVRDRQRRIAMMPTIAISANTTPSLYLTYSDYDERKDANPVDSVILGISIPVTTKNHETFQMEDLFEHKHGTFLTTLDKQKNHKIIDAIKSYIQNMVELLILPLDDENSRNSTIEGMVADYLPHVRVISNSASCKLRGYDESHVNINLVWDGKCWMTQLQDDYHPLWNIMLCRTNFGIHIPESIEKKKFLIPLHDSILESFWEGTLNIQLTPQSKNFISKLDALINTHKYAA